MLQPFGIFLVFLLIVSWRGKGPVWTLALSWLVCASPILLNLVTFRYLVDQDHGFSMLLIAYAASFAIGAAVYSVSRDVTAMNAGVRIPAVPRELLASEARRVWPVAAVAWWVAMGATALNFIDFLLLGGEGLNDLAALRDAVVNKSSASIYGQIASLGMWMCLFCFIYGMLFRKQLSLPRFLLMIFPILGFFSLSVLSAGRQTAFQIMIVLIIVAAVSRMLRERDGTIRASWRNRMSRGEKIAIAIVSSLMIGYMGYIAVARNDGGISDDKSVVLMTVFEFEFQPWVTHMLENMSMGLRGAIVESIIYFSSPIALFDNFMRQDWSIYWGEMTFPFAARQIQRITGSPLIPAYYEKVETLTQSGVIGVGWTTAISSFVLDFGLTGSFIFMFFLGYYSQLAWIRLLIFRNFYDVVVAILVLMTAIYMPIIPSVTETNIFLLWFFAAVMSMISGDRQALRASRSSTSNRLVSGVL